MPQNAADWGIKMKQRVLSGVVIGVIAVAVLLLMNTPVFPVFWTIITVMAVYEIEKVAKVKNKVLSIVSYAFAALFVLNSAFGFVGFNGAAILAAYVLLLFIIMLFGYEKTTFEHVVISFFASVAVPFAFSVFTYLRDIQNNFEGSDKAFGVYLILIVFVCSWFTDTFAYFVGRSLGKHKLCPKISPKKTVEGAVGGIVCTLIFNEAMFFVFCRFFFENAVYNLWWLTALMSVALSVISMFGDLAASTLKRNFGVKDYSNLIPGHGGIMDRFDSCLFVLPSVYIILNILMTTSIKI